MATHRLRKVDFPETSYILYLNYVSSHVYVLRMNVIYLETVNILFVFFSVVRNSVVHLVGEFGFVYE